MVNKTHTGRGGKPSTTSFKVKTNSTLEAFLQSQMPGRSRTSLKQLASNGLLSVNEKITKRIDINVKRDDVVVIGRIQAPQFVMPKGVHVVYEDRHILVINKDAGLLTMASEKENKRTAYSYLMSYLKFYHPQDRIFIVHRLDRETSGLLLFAKSEKVQEALQFDWNDTIESRHYVAIVEGVPAEKEGTIDTFLREHPKSLKMHVCDPDEGVQAITHYKVIGKGNGYALVELELETGRKNQIRVHLAHIGHPIAGDIKYGAESNPIDRLCLHAMQLKFRHPISGEMLDFSTKVPNEFSGIIK